jgi:hypothetical protein
VNLSKRLFAFKVLPVWSLMFLFVSLSFANNQTWILVKDKEAKITDPTNYYIKNGDFRRNVSTAIATYSQSKPRFPDNMLEFAKINKLNSEKIESSCAYFEILSAKTNNFTVKISQYTLITPKSDATFRLILDHLKNPTDSLDFAQTVTATCFGFVKDYINFSESKIALPSKSKISLYSENFIVEMKLSNGVVSTSIQ